MPRTQKSKKGERLAASYMLPRKYIEFPLIYGSLTHMQHSCAYCWNLCGCLWTGPSRAFTSDPGPRALEQKGMAPASESRSIKVNQGQSRWIKVNSIVFEINRLAARPSLQKRLCAPFREDFTLAGCQSPKNTKSLPGLENRTESEYKKNSPKFDYFVPEPAFSAASGLRLRPGCGLFCTRHTDPLKI